MFVTVPAGRRRLADRARFGIEAAATASWMTKTAEGCSGAARALVQALSIPISASPASFRQKLKADVGSSSSRQKLPEAC
jgi:hypothetical protein